MKSRTDNVTIRPMRRKDAAAVVHMVKRLAAFHQDAARLDAAFLLRYCFGSDKMARVWLAFAKGRPVGFALANDRVNFVRAQNNSGMDLLYVEEKWRGAGIGQALVSHVAADAVRRGCSQLHTSREMKNEHAGNFYLSLGFAARAKRPGQYAIEGKALLQLSKKHKA